MACRHCLCRHAAPHSMVCLALSDCCGLFILPNRFLTSACPVDCQMRLMCTPSSSKISSASLWGPQALLTHREHALHERVPHGSRSAHHPGVRVRYVWSCTCVPQRPTCQHASVGDFHFGRARTRAALRIQWGGNVLLHHWHTLTCIPHCVQGRFLSLISSFASLPWRSYFVDP